MREECLVNMCGYICFPASMPGDGCEPFDCSHDESAHYNIDGEATGCMGCEAIEETKHYVEATR